MKRLLFAFLLLVACAPPAQAGITLAQIPGKGSAAYMQLPDGSFAVQPYLVQATGQAPINISSIATTVLVTHAGATKIYVTYAMVIAAGTGNITFEYGTGTGCATGTVVLTGGALSLTAQAGFSGGSGLGAIWVIPANNDLCAITSATVQMSGWLSDAQL